MKTHRPTVKTTDISDLSVEIACALYNGHLLDMEYMSAPPYDNMTKNQKIHFLIEEVAIVVNRVMDMRIGE